MTRVLVTGGTAGIGRETARGLAAKGFGVVIACRNTAKGEQVAREVIAATRNDKVSVMACDLASLASVRRFATDFRTRYETLDVLVNNAGCVSLDRQLSADGYELTFATNHLGPYLLTRLLLDVVKAAPAGRIVTVASNSHYAGNIDFQDLQHDRKYRVYQAYCDSKLANVLFALKLARLLVGSGVTSNALHPGTVASDIWPVSSPLLRAAARALKPFMLSEAKGAEPSIMLAADPRLSGVNGRYYSRLRERAPSARAQDTDLQDALWQVSEGLAGL